MISQSTLDELKNLYEERERRDKQEERESNARKMTKLDIIYESWSEIVKSWPGTKIVDGYWMVQGYEEYSNELEWLRHRKATDYEVNQYNVFQKMFAMSVEFS